MNEQLKSYIEQQISAGTPREIIVQNLNKSGGWTQEEIQGAFETLKQVKVLKGNMSGSPYPKKRLMSVLIIVHIVTLCLIFTTNPNWHALTHKLPITYTHDDTPNRSLPCLEGQYSPGRGACIKPDGTIEYSQVYVEYKKSQDRINFILFVINSLLVLSTVNIMVLSLKYRHNKNISKRHFVVVMCLVIFTTIMGLLALLSTN